MLEPLASSPGWLVSGGDHHPLLRLLQSGRKRQDHDGGRRGLVAHTPPVVPRVLWPCQNTILAAKTLLGLPVGCVLSPPFLEPAILISAALPAPPTLLLPPDLFCCVPHPLLDTPVLHALFSTPQHTGRICSPSRMAFGSLGCPQLGGLELPPGWDLHWCQELPL